MLSLVLWTVKYKVLLCIYPGEVGTIDLTGGNEAGIIVPLVTYVHIFGAQLVI